MPRFLALLFFILFLPAAVTAQTFDGDPQRVDSTTVPDLTNHTKLGIIPVLLITRLQAGRTDSVLNEQMRGRVVRQSPAPGTRVPRGTGIDLWFGYANPRVVPNLVGSTPTEAAARLAEVDLHLGQVDTAISADGAGLITRQRPAANASVNPGTQVRVNVTMPRLIAMPSLIDSTVVAVAPPFVNVPTVTIPQAPPQVTVPDVVDTSGQLPVDTLTPVQPPPMTLPNLVGMPKARAQRVLDSLGVRYTIVEVRRRASADTVVSQEPIAGTVITAAMHATLTIGRSWLPLALIVLLALAAVAALVLRTQRPRSWPPAKANLHIAPHLDTGTQSIDSDAALIREEVLWTSHTDAGTQNIEDDFALIEDELS